MNLQIIQNKIYEIRGQKIMLDFDLAELYRIETKNLNLAVKLNMIRFPSDFMFQLTSDEWNVLRLQFETSKNLTANIQDKLTKEIFKFRSPTNEIMKSKLELLIKNWKLLPH